MIEFRRSHKITLTDGRLLFAAISHVGNRLILVGTYYFDRPIDYDSVLLRLLPIGVMPSSIERHVRRDYDPCIVISATVGESPIILEISYEDRTWTVAPRREEEASSHWSLMTLFKDDYRLLPEFMSFYSTLGVQRFYLYYNGPLSNVDWRFLETDEKVKNANIVLVEWDVAYWWKLSAPTGHKTYDGQGFQHHAQTMAINHHLHCVKGCSDYSFFVDLDEYVFTPRSLLEQCCQIGASVVFQCWWTAFEDGAKRESYSLFRDDTVIRVLTNGAGNHSTKCLMKILDVDVMGIHVPYQHAARKILFWDGFFHMREIQDHERALFLMHSKRYTKAEFVREKCSMGALFLT